MIKNYNMKNLYFKTLNSKFLYLIVIITVLVGNLFSANAQVRIPFTQRASTTAPFTKNYKVKGDFTMMGNTNLTLQNYTEDGNNSGSMVYVDADTDVNTLNSSSATLVLPTDNGVASTCSNIVFAGLYWTGRASDSSPSNNTFTVNKNISTGNTVTEDFTDPDRRIYNSTTNIANTDYKLTIVQTGSSNNRIITYTFTTAGPGNTQTFVYSHNDGNPTLTRNGATVPTSSISSTNALLTTPYTIFSNSTYTIKLKRLERNGSNSNIGSPTSAYVDVTYKRNIPEIIPVTKNFDKTKISLKGPGETSYASISASLNGAASEIYYPTTSDGFMYSAFADVTNYVKNHGIGEYSVADIALVEGAASGTGYYGGWSMIVIYENSAMKNRDITVFDGHAYVAGGSTLNYDISISGFNAVQTGNVGIKVGVIAGEGDRDIPGDYFKIQQKNTTTYVDLNHSGNTSGNFFNSSIQTGGNARTPDLVNNTGFILNQNG